VTFVVVAAYCKELVPTFGFKGQADEPAHQLSGSIVEAHPNVDGVGGLLIIFRGNGVLGRVVEDVVGAIPAESVGNVLPMVLVLERRVDDDATGPEIRRRTQERRGKRIAKQHRCQSWLRPKRPFRVCGNLSAWSGAGSFVKAVRGFRNGSHFLNQEIAFGNFRGR